MFCGYRHLTVDHGKYFSSGKVYINGMEGSWSRARERFIRHQGVSKEHFPLSGIPFSTILLTFL